jgi:hypothetical protein
MPTPWDAAIKKSKRLTVFAGPDLVKASAWGQALFNRILSEFNKLANTNKLGVALVASTAPPDPNGSSGANVQIEVSTGTHTFTVSGTPHTRSLDPPPNINGQTATVSQGGEIIRAFTFLPINPLTMSGRGIGNGAKIAITLHELLHACGLRESDPGHATFLTDPDLFMTNSQFEGHFPPDGNPGDRFFLGHGKFTPPFFLTARTAGLVRQNWQ